MSLLSSTISTTNIWKDQIIPKLNKTRNFSRNYQGTCLEMKGKKISLCPILIEVNRNRIKAFFPLYTSVHIAKILNRVGLNVLFAVSELLSLTNRLREKFYLCYKITLIYPLFFGAWNCFATSSNASLRVSFFFLLIRNSRIFQ